MAESAADRDLLLGVFALQLGFVSRRDFVAAVRTWLRIDSVSLGELLESRQAISSAQRQRLETLAREHLASHGGRFQCDMQVLPTATMPAVGSGRQRFRVVRAHAEGALGSVSVACDEEFQREVAIKEIKPALVNDPTCRSRFELEAEVTRALDHPGIAPVYEIGHHDDGRPFYAMRFVKGQSLKSAIQGFYSGTPQPCRTRDFYSTDFRKLLGRLVDVCHTLEFAHRHGILHRDLKPSNIMLGEHGETVVVDWGVAKILGKFEPKWSDVEHVAPVLADCGSVTRVGAVVGTPAYMSPEQAAGVRDGLGPTTDVYGLGAILYHLLTGRAPFIKLPMQEVLARVQRGDVLAPRQLNRRIPRPLEAICRKAMARRSCDRYQSAAELAEELEQWLADEPIRAYDEGQLVKSARWIRHNMATYTLILVMLLGSVIASLGARCLQLENRSQHVEPPSRAP